MAKRARSSAPSLQMIVSDDSQPQVRIKPGMKLQVISTRLVGPDLKAIKNIGARLCGSGQNCMALIDLGSDVINPAPVARKRRG